MEGGLDSTSASKPPFRPAFPTEAKGGPYLCSSFPEHQGRSPRHRSTGSCPRCSCRRRARRGWGTPCTRSRLRSGSRTCGRSNTSLGLLQRLCGGDSPHRRSVPPAPRPPPRPCTSHLQAYAWAVPSPCPRGSWCCTHLYKRVGLTGSPYWRSPGPGDTGWQMLGTRALGMPRTQPPRQPPRSSSRRPSGVCQAGQPHTHPRPSAGNTAPGACLHRGQQSPGPPSPATTPQHTCHHMGHAVSR